MEDFFESEKDYNRKMLYYISNIYMLFHIYLRYDYYETNSSFIILSSIPLYFLSSFLKLDEKDFENIQVVLTSLVCIYDLNVT